jgi:hypothetical protein
MTVSITDYLTDQRGTDWSNALSTWSWLLPAEFTLWLVNRFGDLSIVLEDGAVCMLDVGAGTLSKVAESRDDFCTKIDQRERAIEWLLVPFVDRLVGAGMLLKPGQCYGFAMPLVLGGQYSIENVRQISVAD